MRIDRLDLIAFGPFEGTSLDLSVGNEGLHIIYGPNEAGKSCALRALKALLFGIPDRTQDNFRHPYAKLQIGARIRKRDGRQLVFTRRKGRKSTLRQPNGRALADDALREFLGSVTEEMFSSMFGIDHEELVAGGQAILEGQGSVGESLFAAGMGTVAFRQVMRDLEEEADGLFKPRGSKPTINALIGQHRELRKQLTDLSLSGKEWGEHDRALRDAIEGRQKISAETHQLRTEVTRLGRLRQAIPLLGERKGLLAELEERKDVPELDIDFAQKRRAAQAALEVAERQQAGIREELEEIDENITGIEVPEALLAQAERIEELGQLAGSDRKAAGDLPSLKQAREQALQQARDVLREIRPEMDLATTESLHLTAAERTRIRELGEELRDLLTSREAARNEATRQQKQLEDHESHLKELPPARDESGLRRIVRTVRRKGDLEADLEDAQARAAEVADSAQIELHQLGLWSGSLEELAELATPSAQTIERFESDWSAIQADCDRYTGQAEQIEERRRSIAGRIEELQQGGPIPTEEELQAARARREEGWKLIRAALEGEADEGDLLGSDPDAPDLPTAYEMAVQVADEIADRLRADSQRVAKLAELRASRDRNHRELEGNQSQLGDAQTRRDGLQTEWRRVWAPLGIDPLPPKEMAAWLREQQAVVERVGELRKARAEVSHLKETVSTCRQSLGEPLMGLGDAPPNGEESLEELLIRCEELVEEIQDIESRRERVIEAIEQAKRDVESAQRELAEAEQSIARCRHRWAEAIDKLGLDRSSSPAQADAVLGHIQDLFQRLREADDIRRRIAGIQDDAERFTRQARELARRVAPDSVHESAQQIVEALRRRLTSAQTDATRLAELRKNRTRRKGDLRSAGEAIRQHTARLEAMCNEAGCKRVEDLPQLEQQSEELRQIRQDLREVEGKLRTVSAGRSIQELAAEADGVEPDALPARIAELDEQVKEHEQAQEELGETIGREDHILQQMNGNANAADLSEKTQALAAQIEQESEQYARLRLAATMLRWEIERYRQANQGPVLQRAGEFFARLTGRSFEGVRDELDDHGKPILVGVRPSGEQVTVGGMSDGTCDQLYLSLRLASLERQLQHGEPMPFIVDDILLKFDDERALTTLAVLADLSQRTQVIFFTHHRHLVEFAREAVPKDVLSIQSVDSPPPATAAKTP